MRSEGSNHGGITRNLDVVDVDRNDHDDASAPVNALHLVVDPKWRATEGGGAPLGLATESAWRVAKPSPWIDEVKNLPRRVVVAITLHLSRAGDAADGKPEVAVA